MPAPLTSVQIRTNRLVGGAAFLAALAPLLVAASLRPETGGLGTHEQLGLPACSFFATTHMPCATCGMTTAFAHAAHGQLLSALLTQPAGAGLSVLCAVMTLVGAWALVSGMSLKPIGAALAQPKLFFSLLALALGAWGYTIWTHLGY